MFNQIVEKVKSVKIDKKTLITAGSTVGGALLGIGAALLLQDREEPMIEADFIDDGADTMQE